MTPMSAFGTGVALSAGTLTGSELSPPGAGGARSRPAGREQGAGAYLEVRDLTVTFDGFRAVDGVDLTLIQGDLRFLIGPNGAGKTTVVDAITGLVPATGRVDKSGQPVLGLKTHKIARLGIGRTFQTASVFEDLTVEQNLDIAAGAHRGVLTMLRRRRGREDGVAEALATIGLEHLADTKAGVLAHGQKQWLEIGMLLVQDCDVMLLDEPVAGMGADERQATGELLQRIAADRTVVVVEHDMDFMRAFATSVTVLAAGKVLAEGTVAEIQADPKVQQVYLGTAAATGTELAATEPAATEPAATEPTISEESPR
ncbi:urea ABC transporter ATP-binding protein UrtD [Dietzia sp. CH92]|uniref:urea ABC transporter ATP-binding protein UrtD n=1 Tax=Dietzia sp. CH92 TaxID=3051823 RepID=UPI0028D57EDC|nr:urea ABC transporter ATP-binding protein UrtD [Dietzia sp. CH92]